MGKTLYLECATGISGDMTVGALLDLGADQQRLQAALASLPVSGYDIVISRVLKSGLAACDFDVQLDAEHETHDHDMAYLYGHLHGEASVRDDHDHDDHDDHDHGAYDDHGHEHHHDHDHEHEDHGHVGHDHDHEHHHHEHRNLADITAIINAGDLTPRAREWALRIFDILARAEGKAHGVPVDQVHFHEVGAVDSIVDIVAAAVCLDDLDITEAVVPVLHEGTGSVRTQHGILPVPVPAVVNIVADAGLAMDILPIQGELVTPTGAAIAAAVKTSDQLPEHFTVTRVGYGAGKRTYERPSVLRAMLIEDKGAQQGGTAGVGASDVNKAGESESNGNSSALASTSALTSLGAPVIEDEPHLWKLETEVDDCSGEALGFVLEELYAQGAREAHFLPVFMKKNRPGYQIEVLCDADHIASLERVLFEHTTTIGIRRSPLWRTALDRKLGQVEMPYGPAGVKTVVLPNGEKRTYPEHDSLVRITREQGISYEDARRAVMRACEESDAR